VQGSADDDPVTVVGHGERHGLVGVRGAASQSGRSPRPTVEPPATRRP
jgi:hypothetical protein